MITEDGDFKKMWKFLTSKRCDAAGVGLLKKAGLVYSDPRAIANILNEQFCSDFTQEETICMPTLCEGSYRDMPEINVTTKGVNKQSCWPRLHSLSPPLNTGTPPVPTTLFNKSIQPS